MSNDVKKNNINGPDAITKIYNTDLGTGKIPKDEVNAMSSIMKKFKELGELEEVKNHIPSIEVKKFSIMGPNAIIKFNNNDLGTGKIPNAEIIAMANVMQKLEEVTENLPSKKVNEVVEQLKTFMQILTLSDCEVVARDVRRMLDNIIEIKQSNNSEESIPAYTPIYEAKRIKEINFFKNLSRKLDAISKLESTNGEPELSATLDNSEVEARLEMMEKKLDTLFNLIKTNSITIPNVEKKE
jgi:hypothetical protein